MRFGDIKHRVYDRLGEDFDSPARYPAYLVFLFIREACEQWIAGNGGNLKTVTIPLVSSQLEYTLPSGVVQIIEVMDDTNNLPLTPMHWRDMYENASIGARPWRDITDTRPFHYLCRGVDKIQIWPTIATVTDETVSVIYSSSDCEDIDDALSDDNEELTLIPREYHDGVVDYVVGRCLLLGASDEEHISEAQGLVARWMTFIEAGGNVKMPLSDRAVTQKVYVNR